MDTQGFHSDKLSSSIISGDATHHNIVSLPCSKQDIKLWQEKIALISKQLNIAKKQGNTYEWKCLAAKIRAYQLVIAWARNRPLETVQPIVRTMYPFYDIYEIFGNSPYFFKILDYIYGYMETFPWRIKDRAFQESPAYWISRSYSRWKKRVKLCKK